MSFFIYSIASLVFFFFSSRRRHTRFKCDWSSDVCSSDLALLQWFRVENEIITRVEEQVYLALRAGRGFTISDLQAMTQLWLATAAYWDPAQHFDNADLSKFLAAKQSTINSDVLPVIQEAQKTYLYLRPPA